MPEKEYTKIEEKEYQKIYMKTSYFSFFLFFESGGYDWRRKTNQTKSNQGSPDKVQ